MKRWVRKKPGKWTQTEFAFLKDACRGMKQREAVERAQRQGDPVVYPWDLDAADEAAVAQDGVGDAR